MIVAGPGTGKTHTLARRAAKTVEKLKGLQKVLAITFTSKAAEELRARLSALNVPPEKIFAGTFHSFCLDILKSFPGEARLPPGWQVAARELVEQLVRKLWPERSKKERNRALEEISRWKSAPNSVKPEVVENYDNFLRGQGVLDYDDLLCETLLLLEKNPAVTEELRKNFPFIFVDEYQDINPAQHALLKILAGENGQVTAIGDPNQAIYGFRGSDSKLFAEFAGDFTGAKILSLSDNYRSTKNLISASTQVIAKGSAPHVPELVANIYTEGRLTVHESATEKAEAEFVVHQIEKLVGGTSMFSQDSGRVAREEEAGVSFGDVAVLYRLKSQARALKEAFDRSGIPYHLAGKADSDDVCPPREEEVSFAAEKVSLMTLHAAKGLEFAVVFIAGCEDNLLPLCLGNLVSDQEEERRLLYVGMTRAKGRLYLLYAKKRMLYGKMYQQTPSPFLKDIEDGLKDYELNLHKKKSPKRDQMLLFKM